MGQKLGSNKEEERRIKRVGKKKNEEDKALFVMLVVFYIRFY